MSASSTCPHYSNVLAAADDLALMSGSSDQMQVQLNKVQAFADWCGMKLSPAKCEASAVLWGTHAANKAVLPTHWEHIQPMLERLRVQGAPLKLVPPTQPFRYLGALLTLTMDWKPHLQMLIDVIKSKGLAIATSFGSLKEKIGLERQCIVSTDAYHLAIALFSLAPKA